MWRHPLKDRRLWHRHVAASFEGQAAVAQAVLEKLETLGYIEK